MSAFLNQASSSKELPPLPKFEMLKRNAQVIFSATKPPMKMLLWNTQTLEHLHRELYRWLEGEIGVKEKIRKIERQVVERGPNGVTRGWRKVENDAGVLMAMLTPEPEAVILMVVIS